MKKSLKHLLLKNKKCSTKDYRIVFTNGCFDILHRGHLEYLALAKGLGDLLYIGLNSDESIKRIKGPNRPINNQQDRKFFLESLKSVDKVFIFEEETPLNLIKKIRPHILVKGGDWAIESIVGHDFISTYGGKTYSLPFTENYSTTSFIQSLQGKK